MAAWSRSADDNANTTDTEELSTMWDSLVTIALELTSRHGHLVEVLALDSEVYSRLSQRIMRSQQYEHSAAAQSRGLLIRTATDACYLSAELAKPLVPMLLAVKGMSDDQNSSPSASSPVGEISRSIQRVLDMCPLWWRDLEYHLRKSTEVLSQYSVLLLWIHATLRRFVSSCAFVVLLQCCRL